MPGWRGWHSLWGTNMVLSASCDVTAQLPFRESPREAVLAGWVRVRGGAWQGLTRQHWGRSLLICPYYMKSFFHVFEITGTRGMCSSPCKLFLYTIYAFFYGLTKKAIIIDFKISNFNKHQRLHEKHAFGAWKVARLHNSCL